MGFTMAHINVTPGYGYKNTLFSVPVWESRARKKGERSNNIVHYRKGPCHSKMDI